MRYIGSKETHWGRGTKWSDGAFRGGGGGREEYLGGVNNGVGRLRLGRKTPDLLLRIRVVPAELVDQHVGPVLGVLVDRDLLFVDRGAELGGQGDGLGPDAVVFVGALHEDGL